MARAARPPVLPQHQAKPVRDDAGRLRVLAVATEWDSGHGGLSTFNRQLCVALAAAGVRVVCYVLDASQDEHRSAGSSRVELALPPEDADAADRASLTRRPRLPVGFEPDFILGHGRITGHAARALRDHFPTAKRLHFVHMAPDEIEWFKDERDDDAGARAETRTEEEIDLGKSADWLVAVGPRLHGRVVGDLEPYGRPTPLRFDPGFDWLGESRQPPAGDPWRVLILGRAEDAELKGLDLAAAALGQVARGRTGQPDLELIARGAPEGTAEELRGKLLEWAASPALSVVPRPYTTRAERLDADLRRASLVLMPSRKERFGLVGVEAIVAGTPVLVSSESGLGRLLRETLDAEDASRFVVPVTGERDRDQHCWAENIAAVLRDRDAAFRRAAELRERLGQLKTWASAVAVLLAAVRGAEGVPSPAVG